jgi:hypothetical protein
MERKKRKKISILEKMKIISYYYENISIKSLSEIISDLKISKSTLLTIIENESTIENANKLNVNCKNYRLRNCNHPLLDRCMYHWINNIGDNPHLNVIVDSNSLLSISSKFQNLLNDNAEISTSFIERWKKRYSISSLKISGESSGNDIKSFEQWKDSVFPFIKQNYDEKNIFNLDETGYFKIFIYTFIFIYILIYLYY